jgi:tetratricopeptide (TPR) repeat protein
MAALVLGAAAYLFAQTAPPALDVVRFNASITDEQNKDIASALREMSVLYDAAPDNYLVNVRLGWLEYLNGAYTESVQYYRRAFDLSGQQSVEALLGLRLPLAAQNDWKSVESVYRQILQLDGGNYEANLRLGQIYLNRGDHSRAKPYLENVAQHYPADYEANLSSAWNDYSLNDYPRSRAEFQTVLMLSPGDTSATRGLQLLK